MSLTFTKRHDDLMVVLGVSLVVGLGLIGFIIFEEWNDQQYFKTLDKLTCEQVWILMTTHGTDWDTTEYFGERCNR